MAKKKPGTSRTTISLPAPLKRRMDRVGEPVNWSSVAALAFEEKLAEIGARKERKTRTDVIERLRASRRKSDAVEYKEGDAAGREWAMNEAEAIQLERLADYFDGLRGHEEDIVFEPVANAYSGAEVIFFAIDPDCDKDRDASRSFWDSVLGEENSENIYRSEFLRGFVQGALDLWNEVRNEL